MKIYTKTGDAGTTALFGGRRVSKTDAHVEAYGTVDELSAHLAVLRCSAISENHKLYLQKIQNTLFVVGSILADGEKNRSAYIPAFNAEYVTDLESVIDALEKDLSPLKNFILAGSDMANAQCHVCRTVCRRAERLVVFLMENKLMEDQSVLIYLNRLSDYLFVLARHITFQTCSEETIWKNEIVLKSK